MVNSEAILYSCSHNCIPIPMRPRSLVDRLSGWHTKNKFFMWKNIAAHTLASYSLYFGGFSKHFNLSGIFAGQN